ncbi:MAG: TlpA disulfide reductase family protein, partial [Bacteroidota bacterium]
EEAQYFQITKANYPRLRYDIFLAPGDSIYISQSSWKEDPLLQFSGRGAEKLQHMTADYALFPKDKPFFQKLKSADFPTITAFKQFIDSIKEVRLAQVAANDSLSSLQKQHFQEDIHFEHGSFLLSHLERRRYNMERKFGYTYPDTAYLSFLEEIDFEDGQFESTLSKRFARDFLNFKARTAFEEKEDQEWWDKSLYWQFEYISGLVDRPWKDQLTFSSVQRYSEGLMLDSFFQEFTHFQENMTFSNPLRKLMFDSLSQAYHKLAPGKMAPDFTLPNAKGEPVSLSDYKGKIVYLDFWGTWCYPCIQEIPNALALKEQFDSDDVVFMYVALEYDEENVANWKNFIQGKDDRFGEY